jgi:hypothetical protein
LSPSVDFVRRSACMLRIRNPSSDLSKVAAIECQTKKGVKLPVEFQELRQGLYRLKINVVDWEDLPENSDLEFKVIGVDGVTTINAKAWLSN